MNKHSFISSKKYNITEELFCILTGFYLIYAILPFTTYYFSFPAHTNVYFFAVLGIVVFVKTCLYCLLILKSEHRLPAEIRTAVPLVILYAVVFYSNRYVPVLFLIILTIGCIGTSYRKILKVYVIFVGLFLLGTILCTLCGGLVNLVFIKDGDIRSSWGINYPTDLAAYLIYVNIFAWIVWKDVKNLLFIFSGALATFLSFYITRSSTSTICGIIFVGLVSFDIIMDHFRGRNKYFDLTAAFIQILESLAFPLLGILVLILMLAYHRGIGAAYRVNDLLSNRLYYACKAYDKYGLSLFGHQFKMTGLGGSTFFNTAYDFIDSSYALILLRFGLVFFIVTALLWTKTSFRAMKNSDLRLCAGMALIAFHSFSEHHFVDLYFNLLLAMPLADYSVQNPENIPVLSGLFPSCFSKKAERSGSCNEKKSRIHVLASTTVTVACAIVFIITVYQSFLSRMRTICDIFDISSSPFKKAVLFLFMLLLTALLFSLFYSIYHILLSLFERRISRLTVIARPLLCLLILFILSQAGRSIVKSSSKAYEGDLDADRAAIETILKVKGARLYVNILPELYKDRFESVASSVFSGDELARYNNVTILMKANYESACCMNKGFLYGQVSSKHAIYTNDPQVINSLKAWGLHLTGYYSKKKKVSLDKLAQLNQVSLTDEGYLHLSGKNEALKKGPDINLRGGDYTTSYKLEIPSDSFSKSKDEDYLVCTLQVNTLFGENQVISMPVYRSQFNKKGKYNAQICYTIPESLGVQFLASAGKGQEVTIRKITYQQTPEYDTHSFYDSIGRVVKEEYYDLDGSSFQRPEGYAACEYSYDSHDNIDEIRYYDSEGKLTLNTSGYAGVGRKYNLKHQIIQERFYGTDGKLQTINGDYAIAGFKYDDVGNQTDIEFYDIDNQPVLAWNTSSKLKRYYNENRQVIQEENYGIDGNLLMRPEGYAIDKREYNEKGQVVRQFYYDTSNKPVLRGDGYAAVYRYYDEFGREIRDEYYDTDNHPATLPGSQSVVEYEYDDKGNQIAVSYYDSRNKPVMAWNSFFKAVKTFNDKNQIIEEKYYNTDNEAILCSLGYACEKREYDAASNIIRERYYGPDGKPVLRIDGYAEVHKEYDSCRHVIKEEYYGRSGKLILLPQGYSVIIRKYDKKGNLISQKYYDDKGKTVTIK